MAVADYTRVEVVVSERISPSSELVDVNVTIAGAPPNTLFCEPGAGTVYAHIPLEAPQTRVYGGEQRREVSFELNTDNCFTCMAKGIMGELPQGVTSPSLGEATFKFAEPSQPQRAPLWLAGGHGAAASRSHARPASSVNGSPRQFRGDSPRAFSGCSTWSKSLARLGAAIRGARKRGCA